MATTTSPASSEGATISATGTDALDGAPVARLFSPLTVRGVTLRNRIVVSPMCQYSCEQRDGLATDWHLVHLASRAVGGAGLVFTEATAVTPEGRISPQDLGLWSDEHVAPLARVVDAIHANGAAAGTQLAHAGRKASTAQPWHGGAPVDPADGGWRPVVGPSPIAFADGYPEPHELTVEEIREVQQAFADATRRAAQAGFDWVEVHAAHGYLLHEFLSPLSNHRTDAYGGSFEHRARMVVETVAAVREAWGDRPLAVRISATDWVEGGWTGDDSLWLAQLLKDAGADLIDCSTGGNVAAAEIPIGAGYQVPFAEAIRHETGLLTGAVGLITSPEQAEELVRNGRADVVLLARELLRDPYWPLHAAQALHQQAPVPPQYARAF